MSYTVKRKSKARCIVKKSGPRKRILMALYQPKLRCRLPTVAELVGGTVQFAFVAFRYMLNDCLVPRWPYKNLIELCTQSIGH